MVVRRKQHVLWSNNECVWNKLVKMDRSRQDKTGIRTVLKLVGFRLHCVDTSLLVYPVIRAYGFLGSQFHVGNI